MPASPAAAAASPSEAPQESYLVGDGVHLDLKAMSTIKLAGFDDLPSVIEKVQQSSSLLASSFDEISRAAGVQLTAANTPEPLPERASLSVDALVQRDVKSYLHWLRRCVPAFGTFVTEADVSRLAQFAAVSTLTASEWHLRRGERHTSAGFVVDGALAEQNDVVNNPPRAYRTRDGQPLKAVVREGVHILGPGESVGDLSLFHGRRSDAFLQAPALDKAVHTGNSPAVASACTATVLLFPYNSFAEMQATAPALYSKIVKVFAQIGLDKLCGKNTVDVRAVAASLEEQRQGRLRAKTANASAPLSVASSPRADLAGDRPASLMKEPDSPSAGAGAGFFNIKPIDADDDDDDDAAAAGGTPMLFPEAFGGKKGGAASISPADTAASGAGAGSAAAAGTDANGDPLPLMPESSSHLNTQLFASLGLQVIPFNPDADRARRHKTKGGVYTQSGHGWESEDLGFAFEYASVFTDAEWEHLREFLIRLLAGKLPCPVPACGVPVYFLADPATFAPPPWSVASASERSSQAAERTGLSTAHRAVFGFITHAAGAGSGGSSGAGGEAALAQGGPGALQRTATARQVTAGVDLSVPQPPSTRSVVHLARATDRYTVRLLARRSEAAEAALHNGSAAMLQMRAVQDRLAELLAPCVDFARRTLASATAADDAAGGDSGAEGGAGDSRAKKNKDNDLSDPYSAASVKRALERKQQRQGRASGRVAPPSGARSARGGKHGQAASQGQGLDQGAAAASAQDELALLSQAFAGDAAAAEQLAANSRQTNGSGSHSGAATAGALVAAGAVGGAAAGAAAGRASSGSGPSTRTAHRDFDLASGQPLDRVTPRSSGAAGAGAGGRAGSPTQRAGMGANGANSKSSTQLVPASSGSGALVGAGSGAEGGAAGGKDSGAIVAATLLAPGAVVSALTMAHAATLRKLNQQRQATRRLRLLMALLCGRVLIERIRTRRTLGAVHAAMAAQTCAAAQSTAELVAALNATAVESEALSAQSDTAGSASRDPSPRRGAPFTPARAPTAAAGSMSPSASQGALDRKPSMARLLSQPQSQQADGDALAQSQSVTALASPRADGDDAYPASASGAGAADASVGAGAEGEDSTNERRLAAASPSSQQPQSAAPAGPLVQGYTPRTDLVLLQSNLQSLVGAIGAAEVVTSNPSQRAPGFRGAGAGVGVGGFSGGVRSRGRLQQQQTQRGSGGAGSARSTPQHPSRRITHAGNNNNNTNNARGSATPGGNNGANVYGPYSQQPLSSPTNASRAFTNGSGYADPSNAPSQSPAAGTRSVQATPRRASRPVAGSAAATPVAPAQSGTAAKIQAMTAALHARNGDAPATPALASARGSSSSRNPAVGAGSLAGPVSARGSSSTFGASGADNGAGAAFEEQEPVYVVQWVAASEAPAMSRASLRSSDHDFNMSANFGAGVLGAPLHGYGDTTPDGDDAAISGPSRRATGFNGGAGGAGNGGARNTAMDGTVMSEESAAEAGVSEGTVRVINGQRVVARIVALPPSARAHDNAATAAAAAGAGREGDDRASPLPGNDVYGASATPRGSTSRLGQSQSQSDQQAQGQQHGHQHGQQNYPVTPAPHASVSRGGAASTAATPYQGHGGGAQDSGSMDFWLASNPSAVFAQKAGRGGARPAVSSAPSSALTSAQLVQVMSHQTEAARRVHEETASLARAYSAATEALAARMRDVAPQLERAAARAARGEKARKDAEKMYRELEAARKRLSRLEGERGKEREEYEKEMRAERERWAAMSANRGENDAAELEDQNERLRVENAALTNESALLARKVQGQRKYVQQQQDNLALLASRERDLMAAIDALRLQHSDVTLKVSVAQSTAAAVAMTRTGAGAGGVGGVGNKPTSLLNNLDVPAIKTRHAQEQARAQRALQLQIQQQQRNAEAGPNNGGQNPQLMSPEREQPPALGYYPEGDSRATTPAYGSRGGANNGTSSAFQSPNGYGNGGNGGYATPGTGGSGGDYRGNSASRARGDLGALMVPEGRPLTTAGVTTLRSPPKRRNHRRNSSVDATALAPMLPPITIAQPYTHFMPPVGKAVGLGSGGAGNGGGGGGGGSSGTAAPTPQQHQQAMQHQQQQRQDLPAGSYATGGPFMYHPTAGHA